MRNDFPNLSTLYRKYS